MLAPVRPAVFVGARLLDGRSPDAIANGVLVTDDRGRISAAGAVTGVKAPRGAERIDAAGLTILPGIIDCHVLLSLKLEPVADQAIKLGLRPQAETTLPQARRDAQKPTV